jgi:curved DNA-binding protein CbpA
MEIDAYEVLQVHQKAELDVIRAAFRTLARKYHPDAGGTGSRMASLNEAGSVLGNPRSRAALDKARSAAIAAAEASAASASAGYGYSRSDTDVPDGPGSDASQDRGRVLDFGRYTGWSLRDLARHDPIYLEWLERTPIGRPFRTAIQECLAEGTATASPVASSLSKASRFSRRGQ